MTDILNATAEIRCLVFATVSVAQNSEGVDPEDVSLTLALLQEQIEARCSGIDALCRDCGEQLQITSPDVSGGEKLSRIALTVPDVQAALPGLSPALSLSAEPIVSAENQCQSCSAPLIVLDDPRWMECTLTYRTSTLEAWGMTESVLDTYAVFCLCCECCKELPFPMLEEMNEEGQGLAYLWTALAVWLLDAAGT